MISRKRKVSSTPAVPAPVILKLDPDAQLRVKLVESERKPPKLNSWRLRISLTLVFLSVGFLFIIWYNYSSGLVAALAPSLLDIFQKRLASSERGQVTMFAVIKGFLYDWLRLLYWEQGKC